jgi:NADH-quinone oxidoreductase subunit H
VWFAVKVTFMVLAWMFIQITLPRLRIDQILNLNWKVLVPLALTNICVLGVVNKLAIDAYPPPEYAWTRAAILLGANAVIALAAWAVMALAGRQERRRREAWLSAQAEEMEVGA